MLPKAFHLLGLCTTALAAPEHSSQVIFRRVNEIEPDSIIHHDLKSNPIPNSCLDFHKKPFFAISKFDEDTFEEVGKSVLFSFTYPPESDGRQCWLDFPAKHMTFHPRASRTGQLDIFRQTEPATCDRDSDDNRGDNLNEPLGTVDLDSTHPDKPSWTWLGDGVDMTLRERTPCGVPGKTVGFVAISPPGYGEFKGVKFDYRSQSIGLRMVIRYE